MHILHINSYFRTNEIHRLLVERLSRTSSVEQTVFVPIEKHSLEEKCGLENVSGVTYRFEQCYAGWHKYAWPIKIWNCWRALNRILDNGGVRPTIVHAHTLITNGILAYGLWRVKSIPYAVTVRNTDVNVFMRKSALFRWLARPVLKHAKMIVLPNEVYGNGHLRRFYDAEFYSLISSRMAVIPNGVDDFWLQNIISTNRKAPVKGSVRLGFIGSVDGNKNVRRLVSSAELLAARGLRVELHMVGDGPLLNDLKSCEGDSQLIFYGRITEKSRILSILDTVDVLVVPSITESFGVVYVEAMTQGIPIVYTKGEGFDGFFADGEVGYAVNPLEVSDIANRVLDILEDYERLSERARLRAGRFDWNLIVQDWLSVYKRVDGTID